MSSLDLVTTVRASSAAIHRFLAYHLSFGVRHVYLFLDYPNDEQLEGLQPDPQVTVFRCNEEYWSKKLRRPRPTTHPRRQIVNATNAYRLSRADWIAHIDIDEFIIPSRPLEDLLDEVPESTVALRLAPAETLFNPADDNTVHFFKFPVHWKQRGSSLLNELYPNFGKFLMTGLMSHSVGKTIARTNQPFVRFGVHKVHFAVGKPEHKDLPDAFLGHFHSGSLQDFRDNLDYRLASGSYGSGEQSNRSLYTLLDSFRKLDPEMLKVFYNEVCCANPELIERLLRHGLLKKYQIDFDAISDLYFPPRKNELG